MTLPPDMRKIMPRSVRSVFMPPVSSHLLPIQIDSTLTVLSRTGRSPRTIRHRRVDLFSCLDLKVHEALLAIRRHLSHC